MVQPEQQVDVAEELRELVVLAQNCAAVVEPSGHGQERVIAMKTWPVDAIRKVCRVAIAIALLVGILGAMAVAFIIESGGFRARVKLALRAGGAVDASTRRLVASPEFWCPNCHSLADRVKDSYSLCRRKFLFVVATGRSGSTTILNMVNLIPDVVISGENRGEFVSALRHIDALAQWVNGSKDWQQNSWWWAGQLLRGAKLGHNNAFAHPQYDVHRFEYDVQTLMWNLFEPYDVEKEELAAVRGFKEITWDAQTPASIELLVRYFPCSRFIFSYRLNHSEQAQSAFYKGLPSAVDGIVATETKLKESLSRIEQPVFDLPMETFGVEKFNELARWCGQTCKFTGLVHSNKGSTYEKPQRDIQCMPG